MAGGGNWLDTSTDFDGAGNWSGGADGAPGAGESGYMMRGVQNVTVNPDQSGVNQANFEIHKGFTGGLGTPAAPIKLGDLSGQLLIDKPDGRDVHIWPKSVADLIIRNSPPSHQDYGVHVYDGGITDFWCLGGRCTRIGALANITRLWIAGGARVIIEQGAAIGTAYASDGCEVLSGASISTALHLNSGAKWEVLRKIGESAITYAAVYMGGGSVLRALYPTEGFTITGGHSLGGGSVIDLSRCLGATFTNAFTLLGDSFIDDHEKIVFSTTPVLAGGRTRTGRGTTKGLPSWGGS